MIISRKEFSNKVAKAVAFTGKGSIEILKKVVFRYGKISSTNLDAAYFADVECEFDEAFAVDGKSLLSAVNGMKDDKISIDFDGDRLSIEDESYSTTISTMPAIDMPLIVKELLEGESTVLSDSFTDKFNAAAGFASRDDIRVILSTVRIGNGKIVATDGRVLFSADDDSVAAISANIKSIKLPFHATSVIISEDYAQFEGNGEWIKVKIDKNSYPNWENVIPKRIECEITVNKKSVLAAIKFLGSTNNIVKVSADKESVVLFAKSISKRVDSHVVVTGSADSEYVVYYDIALLRKVLSAVDYDAVILEVSGKTSPTLIREEDKQLIIMPMIGIEE